MKFSDIMLCCGILCIINAICVSICIVVPGELVCKVCLLLVLTVLPWL